MTPLLFMLGLIGIMIAGYVFWPLRTQRRNALLCISVAMGCAAAMYSVFGAATTVPLIEAYRQKASAAHKTIATVLPELEKNPSDLKNWVILGQSYIELEQWSKAADAFRHAVILSKGNPALIMAYAKAMILAEDGQVSDKAKESLKMVLLLEPAHEEARYFMAIRLLQEGQNAQAMQAMKSLYHSLEDDSPLKATIERQIGRR